MALKKILLTLKWENRNTFVMEAKEDDLPTSITIVKVDEDGNIAELWNHISAIVETYFHRRIKSIGDEMAS